MCLQVANAVEGPKEKPPSLRLQLRKTHCQAGKPKEGVEVGPRGEVGLGAGDAVGVKGGQRQQVQQWMKLVLVLVPVKKKISNRH